MLNWNNYYDKSIEFNKISFILKKFFEMNLNKKDNIKKAIDLGCGSGNDTLYLLNNRISSYSC